VFSVASGRGFRMVMPSMKAVVQRVSSASVEIEGKVKGSIGLGLLVLAGFGVDDTAEDLEWVARKLPSLRIFDDDEGVMNRSLGDVDGGILLISQFTLFGTVAKGTRPSYSKAAPPEVSRPLYRQMIETVERHLGKAIATGEFGAMMKVSLVNEGPVTILIDSKNRKGG